MPNDLKLRLRASGTGVGAHFAYAEPDGRLVIEWYDFGDDAPYESANMLVFDTGQQDQLAEALGLSRDDRGSTTLLKAIQERFDSYFEIREFVSANAIPVTKSVNFMP